MRYLGKIQYFYKYSKKERIEIEVTYLKSHCKSQPGAQALQSSVICKVDKRCLRKQAQIFQK